MAYFPESVIITTIDGIQFKTFSNSHPEGFVIAKPKYIPTDFIFSDKMPLRRIFNKKVNRLDSWTDKDELAFYIKEFKRVYPQYFYNSKEHKNWFFAIPKRAIKEIFDPKVGLKSLMEIPKDQVDSHIKKVIDFARFLSGSGVPLDEFGITFSTLVGHYDPKYSDINIVIYGKDNGWKVINFLEKAKHPLLRWKSKEEWNNYWKKRNRDKVFSKEDFCEQYSKKRTEGFFDNILFVLFPVEKEDELWEDFGQEEYTPLGTAEVEGVVTDHYNSIVRPGFYEIKDSKIIEGYKDVPIKRIVFYSRDYVMQAFKGEKIKACGILERVTDKKNKKEYYRLVLGYPDSYISERREKEFIKRIK